MIKYKSAFNALGEIVYIDQIKRDENEEKQKYICISCGNELITKQGNIKIHHFAHKQLINCNGETYLHKLGKIIFLEEYTKCLENNSPFYFEQYQKNICNCLETDLGKKCDLGEKLVTHDLTKYFDKIVVEEREGEFIPDLKLISTATNEVIFIEIAVTHSSTERKLSSKNRLIEFKVEDENDLKVIEEHYLGQSNPKIIFKNFKEKRNEGSLCNGNCQMYFNLFLVFNGQKSILLTMKLNDIKKKLIQSGNQIIYSHISRDVDANERIYKYLVAKSHKEGVPIKNCFICRYHGENSRLSWDWLNSIENPAKAIFCKTHKKSCDSNEAVFCDRFKADQEIISSQIQAGKNIMALAERDEPHEDYYIENEHTLRKEFWDKHNSGEFY